MNFSERTNKVLHQLAEIKNPAEAGFFISDLKLKSVADL
jgi:hypothetical protein